MLSGTLTDKINVGAHGLSRASQKFLRPNISKTNGIEAPTHNKNPRDSTATAALWPNRSR